MLAITGRSRKEQIRLAEEFGIGDYPCPAGGCMLTDRTFSLKVRDLLEHQPSFGMHEVLLLKAGRHFRFQGMKAIVAKSHEENRRLEALCRGKDTVYVAHSHPGPSVMLLGGSASGRLDLLSRIFTRYSKTGSVGPYEILEISPDGERLVTVAENPDFEEVGHGLLC
jgi:hypothetical protein